MRIINLCHKYMDMLQLFCNFNIDIPINIDNFTLQHYLTYNDLYMNIIGEYIIKNGTLHEKFDYTSDESNSVETLIYEVFRVEDQIPLFIEDHIHRLFGSLKKSNVNIPFSEAEMIKSFVSLEQKVNMINGNVKIACFCTDNVVENYYMHFIPTYYPSMNMYKKGVATILLNAERENPNIKIANTNTRRRANSELDKKHMFEALLVNHNNIITEGSRTNVFFIIGNKVVTAPDQIVLPGIIRSKTIDLIKNSEFELIKEGLPISRLHYTDAAFLTGTSPRILPIKNIEDLELNTHNPIVRDLMKKLNDMIEAYKTQKPELII